MRYITILLFAILLSACGGGSSGGGGNPAGSVYIECADTANDPDGLCGHEATASFSLISSAMADDGEVKIVSRGEMVHGTLDVTNDTHETWVGYYNMIFDAGCAGAEYWEFAPMTHIVLEPGESYTDRGGAECGDMALGERTLTVTLYEADSSTIRDQEVIEFTLVE